MKASELRIGNLVKPNESHYASFGEFNHGIITLIQEDKFTVSNHYPGKWFEPITLTEKLLMELGFQLDRQGCIITHEIQLYNPRSEQSVSGFESRGKYYHPMWRNNLIGLTPVIYVHQLQNLYFALTGNELTIK